MASQVQIRPEPADHYLCHPNVMPDSAFCKRLEWLSYFRNYPLITFHYQKGE